MKICIGIGICQAITAFFFGALLVSGFSLIKDNRIQVVHVTPASAITMSVGDLSEAKI